MKYAIIGTSHAGYEAVQTILEREPQAEIHLYEAGATASFLSCGIQSYLEGESSCLSKIHYANEESYKNQGVHIHVNTTVTGFDAAKHVLTYTDANGAGSESYDKLILGVGAIPAPLKVAGADLANVYYMRGEVWADKIKKRMASARQVVVIGGGYIGIEAAEAYAKAGKEVTVIDFQKRILPTYLDQEFTDILTAEAQKHNLTFRGGEGVVEFTGSDGQVTAVKTDKGTYPCDTVIIAVGIKPNTTWLKGLVDLDQRGFILTDAYQQTSAQDVYAAGDATYIQYAPNGQKAAIALATNARRQGIVAAKNAMGEKASVQPVSGTSALALFDYHFATSGINSANCSSYQGEVASTYLVQRVRPTFFDRPAEDVNTLYSKIYYDAETKVILGAQFMSQFDITQYANIISLAIFNKNTLAELSMQDFFFQPEYVGPWHAVCTLALQAEKRTYGAEKMLFM